MKFLFFPSLFLISLHVFCQRSQIIGHVAKGDTTSKYNNLGIFLQQGDSTIMVTVSDTSGYFKLDSINKGIYYLVIQNFGNRDLFTDSFQIDSDTIIRFNLTYPPPCPFVYSAGKKPKCIGGHIDHIIPIVYGLPTKKTMDKAKKGLLHLGGCIVSDCDPHYYCTIHKIEL